MVRPREEQSTTRCPRLQEHTDGQIVSTQSPSSPHSSRRRKQSSEAEQADVIRNLQNERSVTKRLHILR